MRFRRRARGDSQGGLGPSCGGSRQHDKCQRFLLARDVPPAWGEPARPGFPPEGETGKREIKESSSLPQAFIPPVMTKYRC
jgi:hypothetical protein